MTAKRHHATAHRPPSQQAEIESGISPHARLVLAILELALRDAVAGDIGAIRWLNSRTFVHYCTWVGVEPDYIRRKMADKLAEATHLHQRGQRGRRITEDELDRALDLYRQKCSYAQIGRSLGISAYKIGRLIESALAISEARP